jgi:hypothetical protein
MHFRRTHTRNDVLTQHVSTRADRVVRRGNAGAQKRMMHERAKCARPSRFVGATENVPRRNANASPACGATHACDALRGARRAALRPCQARACSDSHRAAGTASSGRAAATLGGERGSRAPAVALLVCDRTRAATHNPFASSATSAPPRDHRPSAPRVAAQLRFAGGGIDGVQPGARNRRTARAHRDKQATDAARRRGQE